jgi:hypothetical protein
VREDRAADPVGHRDERAGQRTEQERDDEDLEAAERYRAGAEQEVQQREVTIAVLVVWAAVGVTVTIA